jgi:hypothetical protein
VNQQRNILRHLALARGGIYKNNTGKRIHQACLKIAKTSPDPQAGFAYMVPINLRSLVTIPVLQVPVVYYSNNYPTFSKKPA